MDDLISRQAAIEVIYEMHTGGKTAVAKALPNTYGADLREIVEQIEGLPSVQPEVIAYGSGELIAQAEWTELKQEFLRMASYIDVLLECSDEQKETLLNFISKLAQYMPWTERD